QDIPIGHVETCAHELAVLLGSSPPDGALRSSLRALLVAETLRGGAGSGVAAQVRHVASIIAAAAARARPIPAPVTPSPRHKTSSIAATTFDDRARAETETETAGGVGGSSSIPTTGFTAGLVARAEGGDASNIAVAATDGGGGGQGGPDADACSVDGVDMSHRPPLTSLIRDAEGAAAYTHALVHVTRSKRRQREAAAVALAGGLQDFHALWRGGEREKGEGTEEVPSAGPAAPSKTAIIGNDCSGTNRCSGENMRLVDTKKHGTRSRPRQEEEPVGPRLAPARNTAAAAEAVAAAATALLSCSTPVDLGEREGSEGRSSLPTPLSPSSTSSCSPQSPPLSQVQFSRTPLCPKFTAVPAATSAAGPPTVVGSLPGALPFSSSGYALLLHAKAMVGLKRAQRWAEAWLTLPECSSVHGSWRFSPTLATAMIEMVAENHNVAAAGIPSPLPFSVTGATAAGGPHSTAVAQRRIGEKMAGMLRPMLTLTPTRDIAGVPAAAVAAVSGVSTQNGGGDCGARDASKNDASLSETGDDDGGGAAAVRPLFRSRGGGAVGGAPPAPRPPQGVIAATSHHHRWGVNAAGERTSSPWQPTAPTLAALGVEIPPTPGGVNRLQQQVQVPGASQVVVPQVVVPQVATAQVTPPEQQHQQPGAMHRCNSERAATAME
ncbi:unnamed protein product, partial [Sphacelaria rigidula]